MSCDGRRDQILAYLTDGLDPAGQADLAAHLSAGCPQCEAELYSAREVLGAVAFAAPPARPPESAKHRLMERVHHHRSAAATPPGSAASANNVHPGAPTPSQLRLRLTDRTKRPARSNPRSNRRRRHLVAQVLSPAVAAALAVVVTYGVMTAELSHDRVQLEQLSDEVGALKENLSASQSRLSELETLQHVTRDLWNVIGSQQSQYVQLTGRDDGKPYGARLFVDLEKRLGYFFAGDSVPLTRKERYSLWLEPEDNGGPVQAAEFMFDDRGPIPLELQLPEEPRRYSTISIHHLGSDDEEGGGSTATELLTGTLDRPRL